MEPMSPQETRHSEFSLRELLGVLWRGRITVIVLSLVFAFSAGLAAWLVPKEYEASVLISPVSEQASGQGGALGSLGEGLASLAGISTGADTKKAESMIVLQSEALTEEYIRDNDLLPVLFREKWDSTTKKWKVSAPVKIPTLWKANVLFKNDIRSVVVNPKTSIVTMTITWRDPVVAAQWANDLVRLTNDYLRAKTIDLSERNIAYLTDQAAKTDVVGVRQAIYSILQSEIGKVMLAKGNEEFAFKVLDKAVPPERPSFPRLPLWVLGGFGAGLALSLLIVLGRVAKIT